MKIQSRRLPPPPRPTLPQRSSSRKDTSRRVHRSNILRLRSDSFQVHRPLTHHSFPSQSSPLNLMSPQPNLHSSCPLLQPAPLHTVTVAKLPHRRFAMCELVQSIPGHQTSPSRLSLSAGEAHLCLHALLVTRLAQVCRIVVNAPLSTA